MPGDLKRFRIATARRLRHNVTDAERRLRLELRRLPTYGTHFRRQAPIGPYVVDFACMAAHLVIELDGSQHAEADGVRKDEARTRWLAQEGYKVIRFWNNDISENLEGVLQAIYVALYGGPESEAVPLKHERHRAGSHPAPAPTLPLEGRVKKRVKEVPCLTS